MPAKKLPRKKRTHVPALDKLQLEAALVRLEALKISGAATRKLQAILKAASNPDNDKIEVIVQTLQPERKALVTETAKQVRATTREVTARGKAGIMSLSDEEWEKLQNDG